jgi:hypothetical protein
MIHAQELKLQTRSRKQGRNVVVKSLPDLAKWTVSDPALHS